MMECLNREEDLQLSDDEDPDFFPNEEIDDEYIDDDDDKDDQEENQNNNLDTLEEQEQSSKKRKIKEKTKWKKATLDFPYPSWNFSSNGNEDEQRLVLPKPYDMFKEYISDSLMGLMAEKTNQYSVQTNGQSLMTNANEIEVLIGMHIKTGTLGFSRVKMYWSGKKGTRIPAIADAMPVNRFFKLRLHLHLVDVEKKPNNNDRLWKIRPLIDAFKIRCKKTTVEEIYCIDEMIISFTGKLDIKQYIKEKPNPWGLKVFLLHTPDGLVTDLLFYQGKTTSIDEGFKNFGLGASIVLQLSQILPSGCNFKLIFDNYFTSLSMMRHIKEMGFFCIGTIGNNRIEHCPLAREIELKKKGRGAKDYRIDCTNDVSLVRWFDNKAVTLASSLPGLEKEDTKVKME